jgi:hypothetical protein
LVAIWRSELAVIIDGDHAMAHPGSDAVQTLLELFKPDFGK